MTTSSTNSLAPLAPADLAQLLGVDERKVMDWRRQYDWPCIRIGRTIRFTQDHYEQILAKHSELPASDPAGVRVHGQTPRSAARRRSA